MSGPLVRVLAFYVAGIIIGYYYKLPLIILIPLAVVVLLLAIYDEFTAWRKNRILFLITILILGTILFRFHAEQNTGNLETLAGSRVMFTGTVCEEPELKLNAVNYIIRFEEDLSEVHPDRASNREGLRGKILVSVKGDDSTNYPNFAYGDRLKITGVPKVPREPGNPGDFNYRQYLHHKGIQLVLNSWQGTGISKVGTGDLNPIVNLCIALKQKFTSVINTTASPRHAPLLEGILFGSTGHIDPQFRSDFALTGVIHVLSVSGFHVGLVIGLCLLLSTALGLSRSGQALFIMVVTFLYAVMTGANPPVVRAVIMAWVLLLAQAVKKEYDWSNSISAAALLILFFNPFALFSAGFQLSFAATWGILYLSPISRRLTSVFGPLSQSIAIILAAQISVLPITSYYYNYFTALSLPANLIIVPLISLVMLLGGLAAFAGLVWLPLAEVVNVSTGLILELALQIAHFLAGLPYALVTVGQPGIIGVISFYIVMVFLVEALNNPEINLRLRRFFSVYRLETVIVVSALVSVMLWLSIVFPGSGELEITFIDIGQGDAALIQSPRGRNIMLDIGGTKNTGEFQQAGKSSYNPGDKILVPFLRRKGISTIDLLILTHPHTDHIQGAESLIKNITVKMLVINPQFYEDEWAAGLVKSYAGKGTEIRELTKGEQLLFDGNISLEVLNPPDGTPIHTNNDSLVIRLCYGEFNVLFTGDAEEDALQRLIADGAELEAEVVKVPHHGSKNSWAEKFYRSVDPAVAVISVGQNTFGHPSREVLDGLDQLNVKVYRTDKNGAVTIRSDGKSYWVDTFK